MTSASWPQTTFHGYSGYVSQSTRMPPLRSTLPLLASHPHRPAPACHFPSLTRASPASLGLASSKIHPCHFWLKACVRVNRAAAQVDGITLNAFLAFMFFHRQRNEKQFENVKWEVPAPVVKQEPPKRRPVKGVRPVSGTRARVRTRARAFALVLMRTHARILVRHRHPAIHRRFRVSFSRRHCTQANRQGRRSRVVTPGTPM